MNDKINELAEEYGSWNHCDCGNIRFNWEEFAEAIIKESVKALWTEDCHVSDLAIIDFNEKKRKIFKHMGVTE